MRFRLPQEKIFWHIGLLTIFGVVVAYPGLFAPFQLDDHELLLGSPLIRNPAVLLQHLDIRKLISFVSFSFSYMVLGPRPFFFHVVNVFLHILTAILAYLTVVKIFKAPLIQAEKNTRDPREFALFASLIFLVHPLQTESVTYIWQRTEIVSGLLYLASFFFYLKARLERRAIFYGLSAVFFILDLTEKGTILSFPLMVLLAETYVFDSRWSRRLWQIILGAGALLLILLLLPVEPFRGAFFKLLMLIMHRGIQLSLEDFGTEFGVVLRYLALAFLPLRQNIEYDVRIATTFVDPQVLVPLAVLVGFLWVMIRLGRRHRLLAFGMLWFFVYLLSTSFLLREPMWEHRVYLSLLGFGIFAAALVFQLIRSKIWRDVVIAGIVLMFAVLTIQRNFVWQSPVSLLEDAVKKSPDKARPHQMLGVCYLKAGCVADAVRMFRRAIFLSPTYAEPYNNLGVIYARRGFRQDAERFFKKALEVRPQYVMAYTNLGDLVLSGYFPDYQKAKGYYAQAHVLDPKDPVANLHLADIDRLEHNYPAALAGYLRVIAADPRWVTAYVRIGEIHFEMKNFSAALESWKKALQLDPQDPQIYSRLVRVSVALSDGVMADRYQREGRKVKKIWEKRKTSKNPESR